MIESRQHCFPIDSLDSICKYITFETEQASPCLALASIVLGFYETALTVKKQKINNEATTDKSTSSLESCSEGHPADSDGSKCPVLDFETAKTLFERFVAKFQEGEDILSRSSEETCISRDKIKVLVDNIWNSLSHKFTRDKPHISSLYTYAKSDQLDSLGVSFAVVAACQQLGYDDVHLCLSEDHSWVIFGPEDSPETAEVTWHGKSGEERRGFPLSDLQSKGCWVYLDGNGVLCSDRKMELASIVNSINPIIEPGTDSFELVTIQNKLLQYFREKGVIEKYPLAMSNLANSMELLGSSENVSETYQGAILSSRNFYKNRHVFPYTFYGGFLLRNSCLRAAVWCWAEASNVLASYSYTRDDEEVYKEMYDFAVDLLPSLFKANSEEVGELVNDPLSFALLLKFYDGLCLWEDGSHTPVLHINWGRAMFACLSKFSAKVRSSVKLLDRSSELKSRTGENYVPVGGTQLEKSALKFLVEISSFSQYFSSSNDVGILLESSKMDALKELLSAERLRPDAIQLQITAQTAQGKQRDSLPTSASSSNTSMSSEPRSSKRRRFVTTSSQQ